MAWSQPTAPAIVDNSFLLLSAGSYLLIDGGYRLIISQTLRTNIWTELAISLGITWIKPTTGSATWNKVT